MHSVSCQTCDKTPLDCCCSFLSPFLPISPVWEKAWQIFKQSKKERGKSFSLLMLEWQAELTGRCREPAERHRHRWVSTYMHYAHTLSITPAQTGRQAHTGAPHLLRYQNTVSPDKLEWVRARRFLTLQVSVTFLSELHVVSHRDKETRKEPTCHPLLSLSLSLSVLSCLSPLGTVEWSRNMEQKSTSHAA